MYTVAEASEELGLEASHIRRLLINGKIKGRKFGRDWMVLELNYVRKRKPAEGKKQIKGGAQ